METFFSDELWLNDAKKYEDEEGQSNTSQVCTLSKPTETKSYRIKQNHSVV